MATVKVHIKHCMLCGESSPPMELDEDAYNAWRNGELIQRAFPNLTTNERELLMTGTHSSCWDKMFAEEDDN